VDSQDAKKRWAYSQELLRAAVLNNKQVYCPPKYKEIVHNIKNCKSPEEKGKVVEEEVHRRLHEMGPGQLVGMAIDKFVSNVGLDVFFVEVKKKLLCSINNQ